MERNYNTTYSYIKKKKKVQYNGTEKITKKYNIARCSEKNAHRNTPI